MGWLTFRRSWVLLLVITLLGFGANGCKRSENAAGSMRDRAPEANRAAKAEALTLSPSVSADPQDLFEDVTQKAGISFVHQFCDGRIANIIESNGAGAVI